MHNVLSIQEPLLPIAGMLSGVFDPYMGPYIALEKKKLAEVTLVFVNATSVAVLSCTEP
jgi:hypothetical protein